MIAYRITTEPTGPLETPLISGTMWGHLAWAINYLHGEAALTQWLANQEAAPWLISSEMPEGMLPRPLLKPQSPPEDLLDLKALQRMKKMKKRRFIPEAVFIALRNRLSEPALIQGMSGLPDAEEKERIFTSRARTARNTINRLTGSTPEEAGLFFSDTRVPASGFKTQFFIGTPEPCTDFLRELLRFIGDNGFGANASVGHGAIGFHVEEERLLFGFSSNRAMTLSHGVLTANQRHPRYRNHTHFGKLGGHFANSGVSPFKYPILMIRPGSTFDPADDGPFGSILTGVHHDPQLAHIRHHGLHLPIFFNEVAS